MGKEPKGPSKSKKTPELRVTLGGRQIVAWCARKGRSHWKLAKDACVDRLMVKRVIKGMRWRHIPADFACAIERATDGDILAESFCSDTAVPIGSMPKSKAA